MQPLASNPAKKKALRSIVIGLSVLFAIIVIAGIGMYFMNKGNEAMPTVAPPTLPDLTSGDGSSQ